MEYKNPRLTADGAIIQSGKILLIKRNIDPYKGKWALPGGHIEYGERVEDGVIREVLEETGLSAEIEKIIGVYSDPNRDPRGHTVTIVYKLNVIGGTLQGGDDASDAKFFELNNLPELAFDHDKIVEDVIKELK